MDKAHMLKKISEVDLCQYFLLFCLYTFSLSLKTTGRWYWSSCDDTDYI